MKYKLERSWSERKQQNKKKIRNLKDKFHKRIKKENEAIPDTIFGGKNIKIWRRLK